MRDMLAFLLTLAVGASAPAFAQEWQEGVHYERLPVSVATADAARVEVVEVFSYACIHCKTFDPALEAWRANQPEDVDFRRLPAIFSPQWETLAKAFYTSQALDLGSPVHEAIFRAVHEEGRDLREPGAIAALFQEVAGVSPQQFAQVYNSFGVRSRIEQAKAHARAYRVSGVPALVVDGTYRVDGRMAGSNAAMLEVVNHLVAKLRTARGISAPEPSPQEDLDAAAAGAS
ncbi:MAG: thioredoxin domain-containing protein [Pseudomonadales bacterium]|nr:thiol:disulfide interchange protein DsbA/DsbL [Pseudomonadales bacterium]NIX08717.1 thioredoxin domain-containing protein [Pseudomonadales bacterium]